MKKFILILIFSTSLGIVAQAQNLREFFNETDSFLRTYSKDGLVDYAKIKANFSQIEGLYKAIGKMDLRSASDMEKKAFYINAYNVIVIYQASKYYPLKSALDQSGFFDKVKHEVAGEQLTLNAVEIAKLLRVYKDARIHFVLACAAVSCPPLGNFAYTPENLDNLLTERTKLAVNNPNFMRVDDKAKKAEFSKIFTWYKSDFTNEKPDFIQWVNQYRNKPIPANYKIDHYEYDWSLNKM